MLSANVLAYNMEKGVRAKSRSRGRYQVSGARWVLGHGGWGKPGVRCQVTGVGYRAYAAAKHRG